MFTLTIHFIALNVYVEFVLIYRPHPVCADILDRRERLVGANISWARTFHGREHFIGANIFDVCEYFTCKQIFWVCTDISRCAHIF
jgi:hypothetical protein